MAPLPVPPTSLQSSEPLLFPGGAGNTGQTLSASPGGRGQRNADNSTVDVRENLFQLFISFLLANFRGYLGRTNIFHENMNAKHVSLKLEPYIYKSFQLPATFMWFQLRLLSVGDFSPLYSEMGNSNFKYLCRGLLTDFPRIWKHLLKSGRIYHSGWFCKVIPGSLTASTTIAVDSRSPWSGWKTQGWPQVVGINSLQSSPSLFWKTRELPVFSNITLLTKNQLTRQDDKAAWYF